MAVIFLDDYRGHLTQGKKFKEGKIGEFNKKDEADLVKRGIAEYMEGESLEVLAFEESEFAKPEKKEKPAKKK